MKCKRCDSERILDVSGKCSDCFFANFGTSTYDGYVPEGLGIGGGDYIKFKLCLDCGQIQDEFPKPDPKFTLVMDDEE